MYYSAQPFDLTLELPLDDFFNIIVSAVNVAIFTQPYPDPVAEAPQIVLRLRYYHLVRPLLSGLSASEIMADISSRIRSKTD